jgi:hypothetical protein
MASNGQARTVDPLTSRLLSDMRSAMLSPGNQIESSLSFVLTTT